MAPSASLPLSRGRGPGPKGGHGDGDETGRTERIKNNLSKRKRRRSHCVICEWLSEGRWGLTYRNTTKTGRGGTNLPEERLNTSMRDLCKRVFLLEMMAGAREAVAMGIPAWASKGI